MSILDDACAFTAIKGNGIKSQLGLFCTLDFVQLQQASPFMFSLGFPCMLGGVANQNPPEFPQAKAPK